jgi:hypothetical protein
VTSSGSSGPAFRSRGGEGRIRTADTAVFSRVLCQLSYLAEMGAIEPSSRA